MLPVSSPKSAAIFATPCWLVNDTYILAVSLAWVLRTTLAYSHLILPLALPESYRGAACLNLCPPVVTTPGVGLKASMWSDAVLLPAGVSFLLVLPPCSQHLWMVSSIVLCRLKSPESSSCSLCIAPPRSRVNLLLCGPCFWCEQLPSSQRLQFSTSLGSESS